MEPIGQTLSVAVDHSSQIALARRTARAQALRVGLSPARADDVEVVAVELSTNLLHHGKGGLLLLNAFVHAATLQLLAVDAGPGMASLLDCSQDGYSSGSTPGLGLGAIGRLSDDVQAYSWPEKGTVVAASFAAAETLPSLPGVVCSAMKGETVSGDRWACKRDGAQELYLVVDGLGHGMQASEAATMAVEIFLSTPASDPVRLVEQMHGPMRSTRGAALAVIAFNRETETASFCGLGNISASLHTATAITSLVSQNGTVGHQARHIRAFSYPFRAGDLLIMHSDGISTHWNLSKYPGLLASAPPPIAAVLHRDFNRGRDDATALVVRL